jgi:hypothetical protein
LHSTGITKCVTFGKVPSVRMMKSAQLWLWPSAARAGVVLGLAGKGAGAAAHALCQVDDHSKSCHDVFRMSGACGAQALTIFTPVKPPLRAVAPLRRS